MNTVSNRTQGILILLTFVGMVGLYIAAYIAWQKYQAYQASYTNAGGGLAGALALLKS